MSRSNNGRNQEIGGLVADQRKAKGIPMDVLARDVGVSPSTLGRWEMGKSSIPIVALERIAAHLDVTVGELLAEGAEAS